MDRLPESDLADDLVLPVPATLDDITRGIGGREAGMSQLKFYTFYKPDKLEFRNLLDAWEEMTPAQRGKVNMEALLAQHNVELAEAAAEIAYAVTKIGSYASQIIRGAARPHLARVSIKHALKEDDGEAERMRERQAFGEIALSQRSQVINVTASATAAASAVAERGLPSFEDIIGEAEDDIFSVVEPKQIAASTAVPVDTVPDTDIDLDHVQPGSYHEEHHHSEPAPV